jgi:hypothetical protein
VGGRLKVQIAEHRSELKAFEIPRPRSCIVWRLGVGAVYESPKKVLRVGEAEAFQLMSADVRMPRGHGDVEAREYIRFTFGRWHLLL